MRTETKTLVKPLSERLSQSVASSRFTLNFASNFVYMAVSTLLMLWYVPYLIDHLGVAAYGLVPLANSLVMFTAIVSSSLDVSINRFLAIDLNRGDLDSANHTFNTALSLSVIACGLVLLPGMLIIWFFPSLFQVPAGLEGQARLLFAAVLGTTLAGILSGNFGVSSLIFHRFDLRNLVRLLVLFVRTGLVVLCFALMPPELWHVAAGFALSAVIGLLGDVLIWRHLTPQLTISLHANQRQRMGEIMGLSGWSVINQVGLLLLLQTNLVIVNNLFGPEIAGAYGSLMLFPQLIHTLTETVISILSPAIMGRYAQGDRLGLREYAARSVRLLGLVLALPIGLLCGLGGLLAATWLGPEFGQYHLLLVALVAHLGINLATRPLSYVLTAYNQVRVQALFTVGCGVLAILLALALGLWTDLGAVGVAAAIAIVWTLRSVVFLAAYTAYIMQLPLPTFFRPLGAGAVVTLAVALAAWWLTTLWSLQGWIGLGLIAAVVTVGYLALVYPLGLTADDRHLLRQQLPWLDPARGRTE